MRPGHPSASSACRAGGTAFGGSGATIGPGRLATLLTGSVLLTAHVVAFEDRAAHRSA